MSRLTHSRNFNVPDQGPSRGENSRSYHGHHDTFQGTTNHTPYGASHGGVYPQAFQPPPLQPGTLAGYDTPHASQQRPMAPRLPTELVPIYSVQSADCPYPLGFVRWQNPRQMDLAWPSSEGSAGAWNPWAGSSSHEPTSEPRSPYNPGGFRVNFQQNPRSIDAVPLPQGPARVPFSQGYLDFSISRQPLTEDNRAAMPSAVKRKGLVVCNGQTEYRIRILILIGIEGWDQLPPTSRPRLQVTTLH